MVEHKRLPTPFEWARTQLLLGRLQRRQRRWDAAAASLQQALHTLQRIGTTVWADSAKAELARTPSHRHRATALSQTEQRVADLAVPGMSNRDIAVALFVSPKTVETHLNRIYRKLTVHSRVELYRALDRRDPDQRRGCRGANPRRGPGKCREIPIDR
jgi:DNA-binding CsgD family transcriptional regulator